MTACADLGRFFHVNREIWWRAEKEKMEVATGRTWTRYGWSQGAWHAREYVLNECWQIFVNDRLVSRDAINSHAHVQSKAVFSHVMTVMDKICGWGRRTKIGGILICSLFVDLHQSRAV